jgi:methylated-DNA-protein-cysteine methyltransferase-like protein
MASTEPDINHRIWQVVALIPAGKVATYGDVASHAGMPGAARRVGAALRGLPQDTRIPWHRVINAQGRIALPQGSSSRYTQRERLEAEGIVFRSNQRLDLGKYRWHPGR